MTVATKNPSTKLLVRRPQEPLVIRTLEENHARWAKMSKEERKAEADQCIKELWPG